MMGVGSGWRLLGSAWQVQGAVSSPLDPTDGRGIQPVVFGVQLLGARSFRGEGGHPAARGRPLGGCRPLSAAARAVGAGAGAPPPAAPSSPPGPRGGAGTGGGGGGSGECPRRRGGLGRSRDRDRLGPRGHRRGAGPHLPRSIPRRRRRAGRGGFGDARRGCGAGRSGMSAPVALGGEKGGVPTPLRQPRCSPRTPWLLTGYTCYP